MKSKRAQGMIIAILLLVILIILMVVLISVMLLKPGILFPSTEIEGKVIEKEEVTKTAEIVCYAPYLKVGNICCLDENHNAICDSDEKAKEIISEICYKPYIRIGNTCCLDDNNNRVCDRDENYNENDRFETAHIDSPFKLSDFDVDDDELTLEIKNRGDEDYIIKTIDVEDCDRIHPDTTINEDDSEEFDFDCDFPRYIDSDIEIEYTKTNSTDILTTSGRIREDRSYEYDYY